MAYRIKNWNDTFENAQSRRFVRTHWVAMPNKRGLRYTKMLKEKNGEAMFGCWCAIVELASTCNPRGTLQSNDTPYSESDVSALTLFSKKTVCDTLAFCCNSLGWVEVIEGGNTAVIPQCDSSKPYPPLVGSILSNPILSTPLQASRPKPPTIDEVKAYCAERQNKVDPEAFVDFYESKGWMIGKNKMKSWQAAVRTWEKNPTKQQPAQRQYGRQEVSNEELKRQMKRDMEVYGDA